MNRFNAYLDKAIRIAVQVHEGQEDRYGEPYILHPIRVMMRVNNKEEMLVAILHDVLENSEWTVEDLHQEGFSKEILQAIDCLTHRETESYEEYIARAKSNRIAKVVKLADLEDHMDLSRLKDFSEEVPERLARYHKVWLTLKPPEIT